MHLDSASRPVARASTVRAIRVIVVHTVRNRLGVSGPLGVSSGMGTRTIVMTKVARMATGVVVLIGLACIVVCRCICTVCASVSRVWVYWLRV